MSATLEGGYLPGPCCGRSPFFGVDSGIPSVENRSPRPCGGRSPREEVPAWPRSETPEDPLAALLLGFGRLSASGGADRSARPLPPLPSAEEGPQDDNNEDADREVESLTSSDTQRLLLRRRRRGFRDCGQVNYAYFEAAKEDEEKAAPPPPPLHRRLRRSHSGPAGSFHKPSIAIRAAKAFPASDDDEEEEDSKPEVPPRAPIPARALKPDRRRWSAEVASGAYSDEDQPPKVPPREPLLPSRPLRTPSPKSLPCYLHGVMPPTQSFAPDPKYVSSKALLLQRQQSEGGAPCILPIMENGRKASSTHYYLLPERPPYLDRYERFFREAEETAETAGFGDPAKRRHFPCVVSP
nr:PREDICTED: ERBB receptor feedback inhibitor 1 [Anolis carolinensis]|eukprot:XP_003229887.2 PREDICTED: ERBB receptor feedback inhibitor 1 [Anolis carolinensis]